MLDRLLLGFANHLLSAEDWARARLKPFVGQRAVFVVGPLSLAMSVSPDGLLQAAVNDEAPDVSIHLPDDTLLRVASDPGGIFGSARLSGAADFAEALGFVFRNLRWDPEADLSKISGDVMARRIVMAAGALLSAHREASSRFSANITEYVVDEMGWVLRPGPVQALSSDIARLQEDLARLEVRVGRLD